MLTKKEFLSHLDDYMERAELQHKKRMAERAANIEWISANGPDNGYPHDRWNFELDGAGACARMTGLQAKDRGVIGRAWGITKWERELDERLGVIYLVGSTIIGGVEVSIKLSGGDPAPGCELISENVMIPATTTTRYRMRCG